MHHIPFRVSALILAQIIRYGFDSWLVAPCLLAFDTNPITIIQSNGPNSESANQNRRLIRLAKESPDDGDPSSAPHANDPHTQWKHVNRCQDRDSPPSLPLPPPLAAISDINQHADNPTSNSCSGHCISTILHPQFHFLYSILPVDCWLSFLPSPSSSIFFHLCHILPTSRDSLRFCAVLLS